MKGIKIAAIFVFFTIFLASSCKNETKSDAPQFGKTGNPTIDSLTELIFKNPKNADLYFQRAKLFNEKGEQGGYDFAIKDMEYALTLDSNNVDYHHFLGDIYMDYSQSRLAVQTMERAASLSPTRLPTLLKLTEFYLITKQYGSALQTIDKILKQDPQNSDAYFLMGMVFKEQGDEPRAINSFQKAVDLNAENKDAFFELGQLFTKRGNPLALKYFDNALLQDSMDVNALMGKAFYLQSNNKVKEAIDIYRKIIINDPDYEAATFNLGFLYFEQKDYDKARQHFDMCIKTSPTYYKAYYYRGLVAEKKGDKAAALKDYEQALEFKSDYDKALEGVARLGKK
ncbi:MAG: tetratricopeptide repeat protein [Saprospiraceae bacterium]|nr:tetratricopeptide repeat protein [Saprospiraceae bacterium]